MERDIVMRKIQSLLDCASDNELVEIFWFIEGELGPLQE